MPGKKHVHKYVLKRRGKDKTYEVYACAFPDCTHYVPADEAVGKQSVCNRCGGLCIIPPRNRLRKLIVRPHCEDCTRVYPGTRREANRNKGLTTANLQGMSLEDLLGGDTSDLFDVDTQEDGDGDS